MKSTLYLFVSEQRTTFKIGITDNIINRYMRIKSLWGELDLASSCMVLGDRREIAGLEKTLHFLLEKWRIEQSLKRDGHSEWFSMECFDKAIEIITATAMFRESKSISQIIHGIVIHTSKNKRNATGERPSKYIFSNLEFIKKYWHEYKNATIDLIQNPAIDDAWLWTMNTSECTFSPLDAMTFKVDSAYINLISCLVFNENEPSVIKLTITKITLSRMKQSNAFRPIYEFISSELENLIKIVNCDTRH